MEMEFMREAARRYPGDIAHPFGNLYGVLGFDGLVAVAGECSGMNLYIPGARFMFGGCMVKRIREEFNGNNVRQLGRACGYSESHIRNLVADLR